MRKTKPEPKTKTIPWDPVAVSEDRPGHHPLPGSSVRGWRPGLGGGRLGRCGPRQGHDADRAGVRPWTGEPLQGALVGGESGIRHCAQGDAGARPQAQGGGLRGFAVNALSLNCVGLASPNLHRPEHYPDVASVSGAFGTTRSTVLALALTRSGACNPASPQSVPASVLLNFFMTPRSSMELPCSPWRRPACPKCSKSRAAKGARMHDVTL